MSRTADGYGRAWVALCCSAGIHVVDEASTGFLSLYNPTVVAIRQKMPWLPIPTFTFRVWLAGLMIAIAAGFFLSPLAYRGTRQLRPLAYFLSFLMTANGLLHLAASLYLRRLAPGVYSAPIVIVAAVYLLIVLQRTGPLASGNRFCYASDSLGRRDADKDYRADNDTSSGKQAKDH